MEKVDITIIGAGAVGLACAAALAEPDKTVVILEKNARHGQETSSRNSEVIHGGIYYSPGSLKAKLCVRGKHLLYEYCARHSIPCKPIGKIITAYEKSEIPKLEALYKRGNSNGAGGLKLLDSPEIRKLEPAIHALAGILSPTTGILSADTLMDKFLEEAASKGAMLVTKSEVTGIKAVTGGYEISALTQEPFLSGIVINASGHNSDKVAAMAGINPDEAGYRQKFIKGEYYRIRKAPPVTRLIYPLPGELSLGIHLTPDITGRLRLGPSSFPVDKIDYSIAPANLPVFLEAAGRYFPGITEDLLDPDTAGIRPRLEKFQGEHPDFIIKHETERGCPGLINLVGIESPGLTAAPAIAEHVKNLLKEL